MPLGSLLAQRTWSYCKTLTRMVKRNLHIMMLTSISLTFSIAAAGVVSNLTLRLDATQLYTNIGHVLIACNPYKWLDIYGEDSIKKYIHQQRVDVEPHIFATAEAAYRYKHLVYAICFMYIYLQFFPFFSLAQAVLRFDSSLLFM